MSPGPTLPTQVQVRPGALAQLPLGLAASPTRFLVTDEHVEAVLPAALRELPRCVLPPGESSKSWEQLGRLLLALDAAGLDRDGEVLAIGGGVVTDIAGLAAALHRRGIAWVAVPTTLTGQVDAALGGKTAVNLGGGKNTVGAIHAPRLLLVDPLVLATLPLRELCAGLGEVLKTALISGEELLADVERTGPADFAQGTTAAIGIIERCLALKAAFVERDAFDEGPRQALNLGHTYGHAIEALALPALRHGEAVGLGLLCAARLARLTATATSAAVESRARSCLERWGLPTRCTLAPPAVLTEMRRDKKRRAAGLLFVLPDAPGRLRMLRNPAPDAVLRAFAAVTGSDAAD